MLHARVKRAQVATEPYAPTEEDLALIGALSPLPLAAEQVTVRSMILCSGDYDRDFERFSEEVLEQFAATLPGKSLLIGHRHDAAPEGLFFRAELLHRPGGTPAVRAWAYLPRTAANEHVRTLLDTGVLRYVSIGFRCEELLCDLCGCDLLTAGCGHVPGRDYGGQLATATWAGEAEAVEGSLVYLGSQYDAVMLKHAPTPRCQCESLAAKLADAEAEVERLRRLLGPCDAPLQPWSRAARPGRSLDLSAYCRQ